MRKPYGVFVNGLLMNRFLTRFGAEKLVDHFNKQGVSASIKMIGDVLEVAI